MEPILANIYDSRDSIFKEFRHDHAKATVYYCERPDCPLRARNMCILAPLIGWTRCPYGKVTSEQGPTPRAQKYNTWLTAQREKYGKLPNPQYPPKRLAFIGEYVYLPYAHMNLFTGPWLTQGGYLQHGDQIIPRAAWTVELVLKLLAFRPQALFGGEIPSYQQKEMPLFRAHLQEEDQTMWQQVIAARPELDVAPVYLGRKALLVTLRPGITIGPYDKRYPVIWDWDGFLLTTHSPHAYEKTWGNIPRGELTLTMIPPADTTVIVTDISWVLPTTTFVD